MLFLRFDVLAVIVIVIEMNMYMIHENPEIKQIIVIIIKIIIDLL